MGIIDTAGRQRLALLGAGVLLAVAGAIWGVVEVTGGTNEFGSYPAVLSKLFPTVVGAALFGFVIGSGIRLAERQRRLAPIGWLTVLLGLVAFGAVAWSSFAGDFYGEDDVAQIIWIAALAAGQVSLVLSWPPRGDRGPAMVTAALAVLATAALAVVCVVEISKSGSDVDYRLFGILMVLYLLGLVLVPLVSLTLPQGPTTSAGDGRVLDHAPVPATDPVAAPAAVAAFYAALLGTESAPGGTGAAFLVWPGSSESALEMLRTIGATAITGPVGTVGALGPVESVSGRDPEGNPVDLICYPP